jgi:uncharacterized paraquat-inducible protein A
MKYKDPALISCPECGEQSSQRVADLLALTAFCPRCLGGLVQAGRRMRDGLDEGATFVASMAMAFRLESRLSTSFTDDEVFGVKTLRDLAALITTRLDPTDERMSRAIELVAWSVAELAYDACWQPRGKGRTPTEHGPLNLDAPLLDVLDPHRWDLL